jgi:type I restriction enzyme S subunit
MLQSHPSQWVEVPIGEILKYLDEQVIFDDMAEYITITVKRRHGGLEAREKLFGHEIKTKKQYRLHRGAFIISRVQCWHAAFAIVPEEIPENMIASQNYDQFEISPKVNRHFFWWLSHSPQFIETVRSSASGVVIEKLVFNRDAWLQKTLPIPPLTEQRRIVALIESLAARVNEAQRLREEADLEAGVLISRATTSVIDEQNWEIRKLEAVIKESPRNGLAPQTKVSDGGKKMLRINAVSSSPDRYVDLSAFNIVDVPEETAKPFYMQNNEVFVVRYNGDINRLAKAAIFKAKDDEKVIYPDKLIRLRANEEIILPDYLVYALGSRKVRSQVEELGKTTAGNLGISGTNIKSFMLPVPPLDEQRRIVAYLDRLQAKVNALRELQSASGEELSALMPSILDKAFKGEL